jgi:outer membrane immunogenic protein
MGINMRKLLFATVALATVVAANTAFAADLAYRTPAYKAPIAPPVPWSWTGCYIGGHFGGGFGNKRWGDPRVGGTEFSNHDVDGALGGGQLGCNYQTGMWVFGAEADASWADLTGSSLNTFSAGTLTDHSKVDFLGTITGRIGVTWDRALFYAKGGAAWAHDKFSVTANPSGATLATADDTRWGWTVGAGIEYAFAPSWSAKVEYDYMDFGKQGATFSGPFVLPFNFDIDQHIHVVKAGINYKFW